MKVFIKTLAVFSAMTMSLAAVSVPAFADEVENPGNVESVEAAGAAEAEGDDSKVTGENGTVDQAADVPAKEEPVPAEEEKEKPVTAEAEEKTDAAPVKASKKLLSNAPASSVVSIDQSYIDQHDGHMPDESGDYVLVESINVSEGINVITSDANITVDLNGYKITYSGKASMYKLGLYSGASSDPKNIVLTLKDTSEANSGLITVSGSYTGGGSTANWDNGGVSKGGRGGCVLVETYNKLVLDSVNINGFKSGDEGGGICVADGSELVMNGGKITGCYSKNGGAISVSSREGLSGKIKIDGAEISGNTASNFGGGIRILKADFELHNTVVTGNTCNNGSGENGGGGIHLFCNGNSRIISGSTRIDGNTCGESSRADLFFFNNGTIDISEIDSDARIAFGVKNINTSFAFFAGSSSCLSSFICNHEGYEAYVSGSNIKIKQIVLPKIEGYQLVVGGEIKLRVAVSLADYANSDTTVDYAYYYLKGTTRVDKAKTVNFSDLATSGSYYTFEIPIESACMTSPITVTINYGSNETVTDDPVTIDRYISAIMNGNFTDKVKAVAYSLRNFGSLAMMQFNINMNDPALRPANEEINASLYDPQTVIYNKYLIGEGAAYTPANDPDGAFYGASVNFLSKTEVNMYFKKSVLGATAPTMTVTYSDSSTETISATENGSYYVYTVKGPSGDGFAATLFDVPFSFSVGTTSGEYSINTYLQLVEYKYHGDTNNILLKLVEAYYDFARKCQQL